MNVDDLMKMQARGREIERIRQTSTEDEAWLTIPGYSRYQASNHGRIRSTDWETPPGMPPRAGKILTPQVSNRGYLLVTVVGDDGRKQKRTLHRLILATFAGPCGPGQEARHLNDNPLDNRWPANLCWGTKAENAADKRANRPPAPPKPVRYCACGAKVTKGGRRCHDCVVRVGRDAARLLRKGRSLEDTAALTGYPSATGVHRLAVKYGGYGQSRSRRVTAMVAATVRDRLRGGHGE